jgi:molybdenum-dependent DNA-binding transcriptional regulator ModE
MDQFSRIRDLARTTSDKAREQLTLFQAQGAQLNVTSIREKGQKGVATIREKGQKTLHEVETLAKTQAARVSAETQKVVKNVQEQFKKEHLDELLSKLSAKDLLDRLRAGELLEQGVSLRNELFEKLGIVLREDFEAALKRIEKLEAKVKEAAKKAAAKKATPAA